MAQINKPDDYFNTVTWTGDGSSSRNITGVGFQPDWVWLKHRNGSTNHNIFDAVRGVQKLIEINTGVEQTTTDKLSAFGTDGFTVGSNNEVNGSSDNMVSWNWKAGTTSGLSGGTITPSAYSINTTAGFGIYKYLFLIT